MKKLMIDLDETICTGGYLEAVNKYLKTNYKEEEVDKYYVEDIMDEEQKEKFLDYFYENINIYQNIDLVPDSLSVIEKLSKYYDIYITCAFVDKRRVKESGIMAYYKYQWIIENMPYIDPKKIILTGSKEIVMCNVKIDDKVSNLKGYGDIKLLLDQPHNQKYTFEELQEKNIRRVYDWNQIYSILTEKMEEVK